MVRRFSPPLVRLGFVFWMLATVGVIGGTTYFYRHPPATVTPVDPAAAAKQAALVRLVQINGLPAGLVAAFEAQGEVPEREIEALPNLEIQAEVEDIVGDYHRALRTAPAPAPPPQWWSSRLLWLTWLASLALAGAAFILTLKVESLSCAGCGAPWEGDDTSLI
jgi:hypothetical protein